MDQTVENDFYLRRRLVDAGIERISYYPRQRRHDTPILLQHGMWHGAWCWQWWQELFAEWGWESHAISLPGHAGSQRLRPIRLCTLDYYLGFLRAEIERLPRRPVLIGHSMGGALAQWYLRYVRDDLPAAVLLAAWSARGNFDLGGGRAFWKLDPFGCLLSSLTFAATPFVRNVQRATALLYSERGVISPQAFQAQLTPESLLVMMQHTPPIWQPPTRLKTPVVVFAGECDAAVTVQGEQRSADQYGAPLVVIPGAAHNLMMEHNLRETAHAVEDWLVGVGVA